MKLNIRQFRYVDKTDLLFTIHDIVSISGINL